MKHFYFAFIISFFLVTGPDGLAQQTLPAAGGKAKGSGGVVTYTVGQVTQATLTGDGKTVFQGVQIPYEIYVVTGKKEYPGITLACRIYPNPVADHLTLKIEQDSPVNFTASLFNLAGKRIRILKITAEETSIPMDQVDPGVYFLKIYGNNKILKTFKIIKK